MRVPVTPIPVLKPLRIASEQDQVRDRKAAMGFGIFKRLVDRLWVDREIILRSDGRMRFVYLSRRTQLVLLLPVLGVVGWIAMATTGYFHQKQVVAAKDVELGQADLASLDVLGDVADFQAQFAATSAGLQDNQLAIVDLLSDKRQAKEDLAAIRRNLSEADTGRTALLAARDSVRRRFETFVATMAERDGQTADLANHVAQLRDKLAADDAERSEILEARNALQMRLRAYRSEVDGLTTRNTALQETVGTLRTALADVTSERDTLDGKRRDLEEKLTKTDEVLEQVKADNGQILATLAETEDLLVSVDQDREAVTNERDELLERLDALDTRLTASLSHGTLVEQQLEVVESALHAALLERGELASDRRRLEARVNSLETRLDTIGARHQAMMSQLAERTEANVEMIERVVAMTGVNVDTLLQKTVDRPVGQGGPFISAVEDLDLDAEYTETVATLDFQMDRLDGLRKLLAAMPLQPPLDGNYRITSHYGIRKDPINGKKAFHSGMDLGAPKMTPIFAPSGGTVTFAGWRGNYGRMVEIDHGFGIRTRYAHLHKVLTKPGAKVDFRDKIGLVGNSGRSTGSHVHYEIVVDNKTIDPRRFLKAGLYVFKDE